MVQSSIYNKVAGLISAFVLLLASLLLLSGDVVRAEDGQGTLQTLRNTNHFYAYVGAGESLDANFTRVHVGSSGTKRDITVTVSRPGAADQTCQTLTAAAPVNSECDFSGLTASSPGIWRISFATDQNEQTFDYHSWEISVKNGSGSDISGRVWSEAYYFSQALGQQANTNTPDITMWYKHEIGYLYEIDYLQYYGIDSVFQANGIGIVQDILCNPMYKSAPVQNAGNGVDPGDVVGDCSSIYKVFFEQPASDLPATAQRWDGSADWVNTPVADPTISDISFTPQNDNTMAGELQFLVSNHAGKVHVKIDVDGNNSYSDAIDRSFDVDVGLNEDYVLDFDGKDGNGNNIPGGSSLSFNIGLGNVGEIHFVNTDVEKRGGGIRLTRHSGPSSGSNTIYWDDTDFAGTTSLRCSVTSQLDGTAGVNSATGVHGWLNASPCADWGNNNGAEAVNTGSWGDARYMHDWAYVPSELTVFYSYAPVEPEPDPDPEELPDVYVECTTKVGHQCVVDIPEFCVPELLSQPEWGGSTISNGQVIYTPTSRNLEEENYIHLREKGDLEAECHVKIKFIPDVSNAGVAGRRSPTLIAGLTGFGVLAGLTKKYGLLSRLLS